MPKYKDLRWYSDRYGTMMDDTEIATIIPVVSGYSKNGLHCRCIAATL